MRTVCFLAHAVPVTLQMLNCKGGIRSDKLNRQTSCTNTDKLERIRNLFQRFVYFNHRLIHSRIQLIDLSLPSPIIKTIPLLSSQLRGPWSKEEATPKRKHLQKTSTRKLDKQQQRTHERVNKFEIKNHESEKKEKFIYLAFSFSFRGSFSCLS